MTTENSRADALTDPHLCAIQYATDSLRAIAERRELVGDEIHPLNDIRAASRRAAAALRRLEPVANALLAASPVEQPAPLTAQDTLAAIETFEIVGENNDSREPNADDRFILTEFIAHAFGGYPVEQPAAAQPHPDDLAVDRFAVEMKAKLATARAKGRGGWEKCDPTELSIMLREHVEKGDPRDVANFCMFLWALGKPISDAALPMGKRCMPAPSPADERSWRDALQDCVNALLFAHHKSGVVQGLPGIEEAIIKGKNLLEARAASANETGAEGATGAQSDETRRVVYDIALKYCEFDKKARGYNVLRYECDEDFFNFVFEAAGALARSPAMAAEAVAIPAEVIAWRDAYQVYLDAVRAYNAHLVYVRENCPFGTSVDAQYQAMNDAQRKAMELINPMHIALSAAPQPAQADARKPIDMLLFCPKCGVQHIDAPERVSDGRPVLYADAWTNPPHRSHLCHSCGTIWRPADVPTNGVAAIQTRGKADTWDGKAEPRAEVTDWQPIETVPKDGTEVVLLFDDEVALLGKTRPRVRAASWLVDWTIPYRRDNPPTHWTPLPAAPIDAARAGDSQ